MGNQNSQPYYQRNNLVKSIKLNSEKYQIESKQQIEAPVTCCLCQDNKIYQKQDNNNSLSTQQIEFQLQKKSMCTKLNFYCFCNSCICCKAKYDKISQNQEHENSILESNQKGCCSKCYLGTKNCFSWCGENICTFKYCRACSAGVNNCCNSISRANQSCKNSCRNQCSTCIQCYDGCNAGCQVCCGCSCAVCLHNITNFEDKECDCTLENNNPCEIRDRTNPQLIELLSEFVILDHIKHKYLGNVSLIQHKFSKELLVLKEYSFWTKKNLRHFIEPFVKRYYAFQNSNIIRLRKIIAGHQENLLITDLTAYLFFDFTTTDLNTEIKVRQQEEQRFNESEILNLIEGSLSALSYFHSKGFWLNNLTSEKIFINPQGQFKLTDPSLFDFQPFFDDIYHKRNKVNKGLYLSPAEIKGIELNLPKPMHNVYQTDVFVLGMIILEACNLETCEDAYDFINGKIQNIELEQLLKEASVNYSLATMKIIRLMLTIDESERPTSEQLLQYFTNNIHQYRKPIDLYKGYNYFDNNHDIQHLKQSNNEVQHLHATVNDLQRNQDAMFYGTIDPNLRGYNRNYMKGYEYDVDEIVLESDEDDVEQQLQKIDIKYAQQYAQKEKLYRQKVFELRQKQNLNQNEQQDLEKLDRYLYAIEEDKKQDNQIKDIEFKLHQQIHPLSYYDYLENTITNKHTNYQQQKLDQEQSKMLQTKSQQEKQLQLLNKAEKEKFNIYEEYYDKSCYQGENLSGKRHGQGIYVFKDKTYYKGQWFNNKMNGIGMLYYNTNQLAYDGQFSENLFEGQGILHNKIQQIDHDFSNFSYKNMYNIKNKWKLYQGDFIKNKWHGQGTLFLSNGDIFEGNFYNGIVHGYGKYKISQNNIIIQGNWNHGIFKQ